MTPILTGVVASGISGHLTPPWEPEGAYDALASVTVGSGGASSVDFAGIPTGYKHLEIRMFAKFSAVDYGRIRFNDDSSSSYSGHSFHSPGSDPLAAFSATNQTAGYFTSAAGTKDTEFNSGIFTITDYASASKNKTLRGIYGWNGNGPGYIELNSSAWYNLSPITKISLYPGSGGFSQYSQIALYGVK